MRVCKAAPVSGTAPEIGRRMMDNPEAIRKKWLEWDDRILGELASLYWNRSIYKHVLEIVQANPEIDKRNNFFDWIRGNYAVAAAASIRRVMDSHRRKHPVSLYTLVLEMRAHPEVLSREHYVALYTNLPRHIAHKDFDWLAGNGAEVVDRHIIQPRLDECVAACRHVQEYVDKVVAHHDPQGLDKLPTYEDIDEAIDAVGELFKFVHSLLTAGSILELTPIPAESWDWLFSQAWIAE